MARRSVLLAVAFVMVLPLPAEAANAKVVWSGPRSSGAVALTFDDGWVRSNCSRVAKTLRAHNVKATFFINGAHLKRQPKKWRRILKGMPVGNHTRTHRNLVRESSSVVRQQIRDNEAIHERVLRRPMLKVFRPPYGSYNDRVRHIAGHLGYRRTVLWNVTAADTSSKATVRSVIKRTTGARPGSIILMHCHNDITVEALPSIIRHYKKRGIRMVGLGKLLGL
jgi:peptidoglycan/xylan/chitin deacetylase (PgdA/CDA1 family)